MGRAALSDPEAVIISVEPELNEVDRERGCWEGRSHRIIKGERTFASPYPISISKTTIL